MHHAVKYMYAFFVYWTLLWVLYPKHVRQFQTLEKIPFFSKFCCFWHPFQCTRLHRQLENNYPFYLFSCVSIISTIECKCPPPNFAVFNTLFNAPAYIDSWKITALFTCFLVWASYPPLNASAPPPALMQSYHDHFEMKVRLL